MSKGAKTAVTVITIVVLLVLAGAVLLSGVYTISESEQGVVLTFGQPTGKAAPGLHFKVPFIQTIKRVNVQQKKFDGKEASYTRDVQTSEVEYTINYDLVR